MDAVAELPKVMPHIEIPIQAGDDDVLKNMRRGYTQADYRRIDRKDPRAASPAARSPPISSSASRARPRHSSCRPTTCWRTCSWMWPTWRVTRPRRDRRRAPMADDVPEEEKMRRFRLLEDLQEKIVGEINARYLGQTGRGAVRGKGQGPLERPHADQQAGLRRKPTRTCAAKSCPSPSPGPGPGPCRPGSREWPPR